MTAPAPSISRASAQPAQPALPTTPRSLERLAQELMKSQEALQKRVEQLEATNKQQNADIDKMWTKLDNLSSRFGSHRHSITASAYTTGNPQ